jgi:hypothetical protein
MPRKPKKPYKSEVTNSCYLDPKKRFEIGWDKYQWILRVGSSDFTYYAKFEWLLDGLADRNLRVYTGNDLKAVLGASESVKRLIRKVSKDIKLPQEKL